MDSLKYWNEKYLREGLIWGKSPSMGARIFAEHVKARGKAKVLEIGCGYGRDSAYLAGKGCRVTGIDASRPAIDMARRIWTGLNIAFKQGTGEDLEFAVKSFEAVWSSNFLHLFRRKKRELLVREMDRVLDAGGLLAFSVASTDDPGYGKGQALSRRTFMVKGKLMHYYDKKEVLGTMKGFNILEGKEVKETVKHASGAVHRHVNWVVVGEKK
jgi:SAM-dependent methyltransferase